MEKVSELIAVLSREELHEAVLAIKQRSKVLDRAFVLTFKIGTKVSFFGHGQQQVGKVKGYNKTGTALVLDNGWTVSPSLVERV